MNSSRGEVACLPPACKRHLVFSSDSVEGGSGPLGTSLQDAACLRI